MMRLRSRSTPAMVMAGSKYEREAAELVRQRCHDLAPEVGVHEQPVQEDDRGAAAGLEVAQPALRQLELACGSECWVAPGGLLLHCHPLSFVLGGRLFSRCAPRSFGYPVSPPDVVRAPCPPPCLAQVVLQEASVGVRVAADA